MEELDGVGIDETLGAQATPAQRSTIALEPGTRLGSFIVVDTLGSGGMGVVVAAYDPRLDRKVAIKLLRPGGADPAAGRGRLVREAQAMAKLSHPNVVTVHEVGTFGTQVFVAMEFVEGQTLGAWIHGSPRPSWREVVTAFIAAGRGLAAAHELGLVHRDFKPDNVLLGKNGAVKVADFGLVATGDAPAAGDAGDPDPARTGTGVLLGTPVYMAPEQHRRERVGPAADQFSFCVSLFEALYGERPFSGDSYPELAARVTKGLVAAPKLAADVPAWVDEILRRGLRADPAARWPSMRELVAALANDPVAARRLRWRRVAIAGGFVTLAGAAALALAYRPSPCAPQPGKLAAVWDPGVRDAVKARFLAAGAADGFGRVARRVDDYAAAWVAARQDACRATHERGEQSQAMLDLRMRCLDRRRAELGALTGTLAAADAASVERALDAVAGLGGLERCADGEALAAMVPPPDDPAVRARVDALRSRIDRARAMDLVGRYRDGLAIAAAAVAEADAVGYAPARAEALLVRGKLHVAAGEPDHAEASLMRSLPLAAAARDDALAAEAWAALLSCIADTRPLDAARLLPIAEAAATRTGAETEAGLRVMSAVGEVLARQGRHEDALHHLERVAAAWSKMVGPDDVRLGPTLNTLAGVQADLGRLDEARRTYERLMAIEEKVRGGAHPKVATALSNLATVFYEQGSYDESRKLQERALAIREKALGGDHPDVASSLVNLGAVFWSLDKPDESQRAFERALAIFDKTPERNERLIPLVLGNLGELQSVQGRPQLALPYLERALAMQTKILGPDHVDVAQTLSVLASALANLGRHDEAARQLERVLAILRRKSLGDDHASVAQALFDLGRVRQGQGRLDEARRDVEQALAVWTRALGPEHGSTLRARSMLGELAFSQGRTDEARQLVEGALAQQEKALGPTATDAGESRLLLGDILRRQGRSAEARAQVERALAIYQGARGPDDPSVAICLASLAAVLADLGENARAAEAAERALAIAAARTVEAETVAWARFALARALRDRARAQALAREAEAALAAGGEGTKMELAQVRAWINRRPR